MHVDLRGAKAVLQHLGDLVVRQAVAGLDINLRLYAADLLLGTHVQQAIGIDGKGDADAGGTGHHGRYAAQLKAGQAAAVLHQVALALHHMQGQGCLPVFVGGEVLRHGGGNGLVARHNALYQTAHGFNAQAEWDHVQQQQIATGVVACQLVGLDGRSQGYHFIGVQVVQRRFAKELSHRALHLRHAGRAADHHHALHIVFVQLGVAQRFAHGCNSFGGKVCGGVLKVAPLHHKIDFG